MKKEKTGKKLPNKSFDKQILSPNKPNKQKKYTHWLGLGIVILLGIIIYSNSFNCSFHLDDEDSIIDNLLIRNLSGIKALWDYNHFRVIPYFSFALNYHFGQFNVFGYHLVNLLIHLINSCLVYWLTLLIFSSPTLKGSLIIKDKNVIALLMALLFVSHPLATQSVTYIVQRFSSMAAMFYLLSLALYLKGRLSGGRDFNRNLLFAGSFMTAIMALLSKENAFTLPFAIVLVELFFLRTDKFSINLKNYRVLLLLAGLVGFVLLLLGYFSFSIFKPMTVDPEEVYRTITSKNYFLTQFSAILKYIQLLILPVNQNLDHDFPFSNSFFNPRTLISFLFLLLLIILAVFLFKKNRIISFGIFWYFLTLSIESSFIPLQDLMVEHRTYLPSFGFFLILSTGIYMLLWKKNKNIALAVFGMIILVNSFLTHERNKVWKDELTLWNDVVSKSPNKSRPYNNRGKKLMDDHKPKEAFRDFDKAIQLNPEYGLAYYNRGNIYEKEKKYEQALNDYNKSVEFSPKYASTYNNRGNIYKYQNKLEDALKDYNKSIELNPNYVYAYNNRGTIYMLEKNYVDAIKDFNKAIEIQPDIAEAFANRGVAELSLGQKDSGCQDLKKAVDLGFKPAIEHYNKNCN